MFCHVQRWLAGCAAVALLLLAADYTQAQDPIVRIEEDWELTVKVPDYEITAPQIITAITPLQNLAGVHATLEINHLSSVAFATGGLHLSTWCGDTHLAVCHAGNFASMYTDGEVVRWTQAMSLKDGRLEFEVVNGTSTTWGNFGGNGSLRLDLATTLQDLSTYSPAVSARESEVSYASNRVQTLVLRRVKYTRASGQTTTENATKYIYQTTE